MGSVFYLPILPIIPIVPIILITHYSLLITLYSLIYYSAQMRARLMMVFIARFIVVSDTYS